MDPYIFAGDRNTYLDGPRLQDPSNIPDIPALAHALSQINRFTGHTVRAYSVAEHSLLCCEIARSSPLFESLCKEAQVDLLIACLVHDMHEALTGDQASPLKLILGEPWREFEDNLQRAVLTCHGEYDNYVEWQDRVKGFDLIALATEKRDLLPGAGEWRVLAGIEPVSHTHLSGTAHHPATYWRDTFIECFNGLRAMCFADVKGDQE